MSDPQWSPVWPTEPGTYWFYGSCDFTRRCKDPPRLRIWHVRGKISYSDGSLIFPSEGWEGHWMRIPEPPLPE